MKNDTSSNCGLTHQTTVCIAIVFMALVVMVRPQKATAQVPVLVETPPQSSSATSEYWTPERMKNAIPMDLKAVSTNVVAPRIQYLPPDAVPSFAPGFKPGSAPEQDSSAIFKIAGSQPHASAPFGPPANPTDFANYAPFQRYRFPFKFTQYPMSTIGKLFFSRGGQNFVCSASVIGSGVIATAGHCVHAGSGGAGGYSTGFQFCPSYNAGGMNPAVGCWNGVAVATSIGWSTSGDIDRDYACIVMATTGSVHALKIGFITGATGRAANFSSRQLIHAFGYPAGSPFPGNQIVVVTSPEWYEMDQGVAGGQMSKYIGSDMTGGSSGGPWWINFAHPGAEHADTDGSSVTDPAQGIGNLAPYLNGVNSHSRCVPGSGCSAGSVFTQEMGSAQFRNTVGDTDESEDVFGVCLAHPNNAMLNKSPMSDRLASAKAPKRTISRGASVTAQRSKGL
jgi:V8-like Glu-specific endopeptidase